MDTRPSLSQRVLHALPSISDQVVVGLFALMIFVFGMLVGNILTRAGHINGHAAPSPTLLQHQIEVLEHRVWMLEHAKTP